MKLSGNGPVVMLDDNPADLLLAQTCFDLSTLSNPWLAFPSPDRFFEHLADVKAGRAPMPALVLLDINMPRVSGHEVLRRVRNDPHFRKLPVVCMLTSSEEARDRRDAEALGASGFAVKPDGIDAYVAFFDSLAP